MKLQQRGVIIVGERRLKFRETSGCSFLGVIVSKMTILNKLADS
jgi:hypothetical protein